MDVEPCFAIIVWDRNTGEYNKSLVTTVYDLDTLKSMLTLRDPDTRVFNDLGCREIGNSDELREAAGLLNYITFANGRLYLALHAPQNSQWPDHVY